MLLKLNLYSPVITKEILYVPFWMLSTLNTTLPSESSISNLSSHGE